MLFLMEGRSKTHSPFRGTWKLNVGPAEGRLLSPGSSLGLATFIYSRCFIEIYINIILFTCPPSEA